MEELTQKLGRMPDDPEVCDRMGLSLEGYQALLEEVNVTVLLSLDDSFPSQTGDGGTLSEVATDPLAQSSQEHIEEVELRDLLVDNLKMLPEQEKLVLALYYYEELTFKEIGDVLKLTESRVSQIHSKAILKLRSGVRQTMNR